MHGQHQTRPAEFKSHHCFCLQSYCGLVSDFNHDLITWTKQAIYGLLHAL